MQTRWRNYLQNTKLGHAFIKLITRRTHWVDFPSVTQWAAVKILFQLINEPPQNLWMRSLFLRPSDTWIFNFDTHFHKLVDINYEMVYLKIWNLTSPCRGTDSVEQRHCRPFASPRYFLPQILQEFAIHFRCCFELTEIFLLSGHLRLGRSKTTRRERSLKRGWRVLTGVIGSFSKCVWIRKR